jgi:isopenicillin-N N-acyltransferase-like protein
VRIRELRLAGDAVARGRAHGEAFAAEIREYCAERVGLASNGAWAGRTATRGDVLGLAERMLPAHRAYAPELFIELESMAIAADISPAEALITGGFTDFVDAVRAAGGPSVDEDDCTAALVPDSRAGGSGFLVQTWDMHASATPHVLLLDVQPEEGPAARIFTTVGCLAQIGMNAAGIAVGINNLSARDGRVGVTWPFVVRKALATSTIDDALACVVEAPLAGGHNYLLLDATGRGYNVEAMPTYKAVTALEHEPIVHTNHPIDAEVARREASRPTDLAESSHRRLDLARSMLASRRVGLDDLVRLTAEPSAICRHSEPPHHMETSGAVIARPRTRELWAVWGLPSENPYERFVVA